MDLSKTFIDRSKEIKQISKALSTQNHVLIEGFAGIGKTTLVNIYRQLNPLRYKEIHFFSGYELELDETKLATIFIVPKGKNQKLIIIDGYDEIISLKTKEILLRAIKEARKYGTHIIMTMRPGLYDKVFERNAFKIILRGFNIQEASDFIKQNFSNELNETIKLENLSGLLKKLDGSPYALKLAMHLLKEGVTTPDQLRTIIDGKIDYRNKIITDFDPPKIISLRSPKIIQDVKLVNISILQKIDRNPNQINALSQEQFEYLVAELFEEKGYRVNLTNEIANDGRKLITLENSIFNNFMIYADCKKQSLDDTIGVKVIKELYGTVTADKATAGMVITSSYFSEDALNFTESIKHQMTLVDYVKLNQWMNLNKI